MHPCTTVTCLGIEVDTVNFPVSVPHEKLAKNLKCVKNGPIDPVLYVSKCVKSSQVFLNRMLDTL